MRTTLVLLVGAVLLPYGWVVHVERSARFAAEERASKAEAVLERFLGGTESAQDRDGAPIQADEIKTLSEARALLANPKPTASELADALATLDEWFVRPAEEEEFRKLKVAQLARLRTLVKDEVQLHQREALKAGKSREAADRYAEAGRVLALYPLSDDREVVKEARQLAYQQADVVKRLEVIRRQRYNSWAVAQIEQALDYWDKNRGRLNPFASNEKLIEPIVKQYAGPVDPLVLEPAALDLYNYLISRVKEGLSDPEKLKFTKGLSDPTIDRKPLGDF